ncbi:unnamed protein product [Spirodela intermedia]|uniref:MLO-like protein n=1 Tax=Spirodela intermedia TaxID=51605 RepID=A0A7I8K1X5_SPIIN|nr:unnamed protein product [Spirodela intermedia]
MAGGGGRSLEETPTWAVAVVCLVLVLISLLIEHLIWLARRNKRALYESLEKVKSELMLLGFISLLLTVGQGPISNVCVSESLGNTWLPCPKSKSSSYESSSDGGSNRRKLLQEVYAAASTRRGKVSLISTDGIHQLHIFIFVLAVFHVGYCITTLAFGRLKMRSWKAWEKETKTMEYQFSNDPARFRFARDTTFGRRHLSSWSESPVLIWIVCFFRQFFRSVPKVDYLTLRHGFIMAHLAPHSNARFDFQKYINRSLEEEFKVVVGINPVIWFFAVLFLVFNTHGWRTYLWLPFIPLIIILLIGTKLQVIVTRMALKIMERGDVVKGTPVVQPTDDHFWFNRPKLLLYLIHFVLFQNAFQLAFFVVSWYQFGFSSCFHDTIQDSIIRISMGVIIQVLCSYVTLPLYALVTQMGSNMKPTIFNDTVASALRKWHRTAKKHIKEGRKSGTVTPVSSRPATPTHGLSPVHLLKYHRNEMGESPQASPRFYGSDNEKFDHDGSLSPPFYRSGEGSTNDHHADGAADVEELRDGSATAAPPANQELGHHAIEISGDFSFRRRDRA